MASHFYWYPSSDSVIIPWTAPLGVCPADIEPAPVKVDKSTQVNEFSFMVEKRGRPRQPQNCTGCLEYFSSKSNLNIHLKNSKCSLK